MALKLLVFLDFNDQQHRRVTLEFYATPPASLGPAVDLPTQAQILAVANAMVKSDMTGISDGFINSYGVKVIQDDITGITANGNGGVALTNAFKTRSGINTVGRIDPFGNPEGIELRIPGANQKGVIFSPTDRNVVSMTGNWDTLRAALLAIGYQDAGGTVFISGQILQQGTFFDGKRSPMRPR
jgi:hypothetical protein